MNLVHHHLADKMTERDRHRGIRKRIPGAEQTAVRRRRVLLAVLMAFFVLVSGSYFVYATRIRGKYEPKSRSIMTNEDPVLYKSEGAMTFAMSLRFPKLSRLVRKTYVVPGMRTTRTLIGEFRAATVCTSMTPQGMCVTEDYIVISAYCHTLRHNSVLYLIRKSDGSLQKTIPLAGQAHVGGLAYDPVHQNVWVSGGTYGAAKAIAYRLEDLVNYDEESNLPVQAVYNYTLATMTTNSYMNYAGNMLVAGIFSRSGKSEISWFDLTEEGGLYARIFEDYDPVHETVAADYTAVTSGEIQGVSQNEIYLLLSKSYGPFDSAIQIYEYDRGRESFTDRETVKTLKFPQKLEQICEYDGQLYCLFESQAYAYRAQPFLGIDRILVFDIEDLLP